MINNLCLFWAMKILATRERILQFFQKKRKEHTLMHFPKSFSAHKLNADANACIEKCQKGKLNVAKIWNILLKATFSTISFSKEKGRLNETFQFRIKNAFDTSNNNE